MVKPNFFIVGAAKSGTTSLFEYLRKHQDIYMPAGKDLAYFGGREYRADTRPTATEYYAYFKGADKYSRVGEASVSYLFSERTAKSIYEELGADIKIIIILRNPVRVAYSLWGQNTKDGHETLSFADALKHEKTRLQDKDFIDNTRTWLYNFAYIDRVKYFRQVERYINTFKKENVKILIYEDFFSDPETQMKSVFDFLGVENFKLSKYPKYNQSGKFRYKTIQNIYKKSYWWKTPIKTILPKQLRKALSLKLYYLNSKSEPLPEIPKYLFEYISNEINQDISSLEELLDFPFIDYWKLSK